MKKVFDYLRSMRFANLLLALVALLCGLSSLLPQGRELPFYAQNYPKTYLLIYRTHFYRVFESWYFVLLCALLCLSLGYCTVRMLLKTLREGKTEAERAAALPNAEKLAPGGLEELRLYMASHRCREEKRGGVYVFRKNGVGRWGTFLLHLGVLLVVVFGVFALYLPKVTDVDCLPGESVKLEDGTVIRVEAFTTENRSGQVDYASVIRVTLPDGRESESREIRVNYPMTFGNKKIFQWSYGVSGIIVARNQATGTEDRLSLKESAFLSPDGVSGIEYQGVFEAVPQDDPGGKKILIYQIRVISNGKIMPAASFQVGDTVTVGDWEYRFESPYYPGLRVKEMPNPYTNSLLEGALVLLTLGIFLTFFWQPVVVKADEAGYCVAGPRPEKLRLELRRILEKEGEKT